jgi:hypothetical protein
VLAAVVSENGAPASLLRMVDDSKERNAEALHSFFAEAVGAR